jgi:hypothetical protein
MFPVGGGGGEKLHEAVWVCMLTGAQRIRYSRLLWNPRSRRLNLASNTGKGKMNYVYWKSNQIVKRGRGGILLWISPQYTYTLYLSQTPVFLFAPLKLGSKKKKSYVEKVLGGWGAPNCHHPSYAYASSPSLAPTPGTGKHSPHHLLLCL